MEYIGKGVYTLSDVYYMTNISKFKLLRWTNGYTYKKDDKNHFISPIFGSDYKFEEANTFFSFLDLVELLFIDSFEKHGLSLQSIRRAAESASKIFETTHPFAKKAFYTDGKTILARIAEENNDPDLLDLLKKQYQMEPIIAPSLYECLDFDKVEIAEKWWPLGKKNRIVIDPKRNFGKPIIDDVNIRVDTIIDLINRKKSISDISEWYEIDEKTINSAIDYHKRVSA